MGTKLVLSTLLAVAGTSAAFNVPTTMPSIAGARVLRSPMSSSVKMQCGEAGTEATWKGERRGAIMATGSALVASFFLAKPANAAEVTFHSLCANTLLQCGPFPSHSMVAMVVAVVGW